MSSSIPSSFVKHKVGHHFNNAHQEFDAAKLGTWVFLAQEVLFFSILFISYAVFRNLYPEMYKFASQLLDWKLGAFNTLILIVSSFTMVMSVRSAQTNNRKMTLIFLAITISCGLFFMVIKAVEYSHKIHDGYLTSYFFTASITEEVNSNIFGANLLNVFFGIYFALTGLHGIHVLVGIGLLIWMYIKAYRWELHSEYFTPLEMVGLYWHLVDLIWIFLFPLLYLV